MDAERPQAPLAPREGRWIARPNRTPWYLKMGASAAILGQTPNWLRMLLEPFFGKERAWAVVLAVFAVFLLAVVASAWWVAVRRKREEIALLDEGFGDQFAVSLVIVSDKRHLGIDTGVLWFADGLMGFSGRSSSFVLASRNIRLIHKVKKHKGRVSLPKGVVQLRGAPTYAYLAITPRYPDRKRYQARLKQFEEEEADPAAERFWPPLVPYEVAPAEAKAPA